MNVFVTGGNGFVGQQLNKHLCSNGYSVFLGERQSDRKSTAENSVSSACPVQWAAAIAQCHAVIHLAARVHVMHDTADDPLALFRLTNVELTLNLARQAAEAGVRRFIFISSVKVNGEYTVPGRAFKFSDAPAPQDPYGISKAEAEDGLREIAFRTGMEVVIIRPPLVYGPGVKANFETMMRLVRMGLPMPLGAIHNLRSLVALDNLVDLIVTCLKHSQASNQTLMVSDGHDLSTTDLLRGLANAMGRPAYLLPVPAGWLEMGFRLAGRQHWAKRLCGNLQVDISHTCSTLGWHPPVSVAEGLLRTMKG